MKTLVVIFACFVLFFQNESRSHCRDLVGLKIDFSNMSSLKSTEDYILSG